MLGFVGGGDWREIIGHDGYFVVRLRIPESPPGPAAVAVLQRKPTLRERLRRLIER